MINNNIIRNFINQLANCYFVERDIDNVIKLFHKNISWFGSGKGEVCYGINEAKRLLDEEKIKDHMNFDIIDHSMTIDHISNDIILVNSIVILKEKSEYNLYDEMRVRVTSILKIEDDQIYIYHIHLSIPNKEQLKNDVFPANYSLQAPRILEHLVEEKIDALKHHGKVMKMISDNIPGGMFQVKYDEKLTFLEMSNGFLKMFGYTREDIAKCFNNSFFAMIDVRDRARTLLEVKKQIANESVKVIEYRVTCKDGSTVWVLDKGQVHTNENGERFFACIVIDITESKIAEEELRLSMERYKIILDQSSDIIFEWNIITDRVQYSQNWYRLFKCDPTEKNVSVNLCDESYNSRIHPDDRIKMKEMIQNILNGQVYTEGNIRIRNNLDIYLWCRFKMTTIFDEVHNPIKVVGVIFNVDEEIKQSQTLLKMAREDSLTKTYNRVAAQNIIIDILKNHNIKDAFMIIIDLDNFKNINDTKGHLFGDVVLSEVAAKMKECFHTDAVVSRVGGDEFLVFMVGKLDIILKAIDTFLREIKLLSCNKELSSSVSCSVGIACFPKDGVQYNDLFYKADQSLYYAKKKGKSCYALYNQEMMNEFPGKMSKSMIYIINEKHDFSDEVMLMNEKLGEYIFKLLYKSIDINKAVSKILELVGKQYNVSRVYVFKNDSDNGYCSNTFEWCNESIEPQINKLQNIPYQDDLVNFNEDGIYYCKDTKKLPDKLRSLLRKQKVKSLLLCAIKDNGEFIGFIGFDECNNYRIWTQEQINILKFISETLSTFLMKKISNERLNK
ncbi:diguanylate cyclase [Thomasclavelia sp.]